MHLLQKIEILATAKRSLLCWPGNTSATGTAVVEQSQEQSMRRESCLVPFRGRMKERSLPEGGNDTVCDAQDPLW